MKFITMFFAAVLMVGCAESEATDVVIDPFNLVRNTITSINQIQATANSVRSLAVQQQDFILQTRNLATVSDSLVAQAINRGMLPADAYGIREGAQIAKQAAGVYATLKSSQDEMTKMLNVLTRVEAASKSLERQALISGLDPNVILQSQAKEADAGRAYAVQEYTRLKSDLGQLEFHQKRMDAIASALPTSSGAQQSLQMLGLQNGVLSDQLSQMLTVQTSMAVSQQKRDIQLSDEQLRNWHIDMQAKANSCRMGSQSKSCPEAMKYYDQYMKGKNGYK